MSTKEVGPFFVDATGGGLAALAAGIARSLGHTGALAATTSDSIVVPPEVALALKEIGAELPSVRRAADLPAEGRRIDPSAFAFPLHPGEGDLERRAAARIARDRIERYLERHGAR